MQIIGRVDDLLNIGGIKVAPHALEELISKNVKVKDVGICTTLTPDGIEGLCVAISTDEVLDMGLVEEIGRCFGNQCGKIRFMWVDSIPRTDTGKIQRALLKGAFVRVFQNSKNRAHETGSANAAEKIVR